MTAVLLDMAVSLDGYVSPPGGGDGGLHDWYFDPQGASREIVAELEREAGAILLGRNAYGAGDDAAGWDDTPYDVPHIVLTHRPPGGAPSLRNGPVEFRFVTEGIEAAVAAAKEAAGERLAVIGGGADIARQALRAGLVDEVQLHVVPRLFGGGLPLFAPGGPAATLTRIRTVDGPAATHLRYRVTHPS